MGLMGLSLVGLHAVLAALSAEFVYGTPLGERPIVTLVLIECLAGVMFLTSVVLLRRIQRSGGIFAWILAVGLALRCIMFLSTPMLEDDYYRYLWDAAVLANGMNPYTFAPTQVLDAKARSDGNTQQHDVTSLNATRHGASESVPKELQRLAAQSGEVISRVNHPHLRTIYPVFAQTVFAAAYYLKPWSLNALRVVLGVFDVATLALLIAILRQLNLPVLMVVIYWWNPVVVKEIFNSAHMDAIVLPPALIAVMLAARGREIGASLALGVAVAAKVWPLALLPVVVSPLWNNWRRLMISVGLFCLVGGLMFVPVVLGGMDPGSGFLAYGKQWEMNDALYMLILWGVESFLGFVSLSQANAQLVTRGVVILLLLAWTAWISRTRPARSIEFWQRSLWIVAALFLLSPTQFPWYYLWLIPFLVIQPRKSLLCLTVLLPVYYLRFYFRDHDNVAVFDTYIVWLEYLPVWLLLAWEWWRPAPSF